MEKEAIIMGETFGARLAKLMKEKNYTQKELALRAGVTEAAMSHYVKGDRIPRAIVMSRIANALNTTSEYLLSETVDSSEDNFSQVKKLIARNVSQMSQQQKMEIINILFND